MANAASRRSTRDRESQTATAGTPLAKQLRRVGLWTSKLDLQPADQLRSILTELEALGWGALWSWEVFGREALTNAGLLLCTSQQLVIGTGIANIWARDPVAMAAAGRTLAEAYPGRFVLGLGVSPAPRGPPGGAPGPGRTGAVLAAAGGSATPRSWTPAVTGMSGRWSGCAPT